MKNFSPTLKSGLILLASAGFSQAQNYRFDSTISRAVLNNYLSRAVSIQEILTDDADCDVPTRGSSFAEGLRFIRNTGTKFLGRAVYRWGRSSRLPNILLQAKPRIDQIHAQDPDIVVQACVFEMVQNTEANNIPIPPAVFTEFGLPIQTRNFVYNNMIFIDGFRVNSFGTGSSVPDMSRIETKMWFFYFATSYIDIGAEAIHFGQVELMNHNDPNNNNWFEVLTRIRNYARQHARHHMVLCDGHVPSGTFARNGALLLDSHAFPLRIKEVAGMPTQGVLQANYVDAIYGKSGGGVTPSGWTCAHLPYLVEFDNFGISGTPGQPSPAPFVWGWDEISWLANQTETYRNNWLRYASNWLAQNDTNGHLQMPAARLAVGFTGRWYWGYTRSAASPNGQSQEDTIKAIWQSQATSIQPLARGRSRLRPGLFSHAFDFTGWDILGRNNKSAVERM